MKNNYYDKNYFLWQKAIGEFSVKVGAFKFQPFVNENDTVLDFGCGGGYIISSLTCKRRIGIEINEIARQEAAEKGIEVYKYSNEVPDDSCDLIISNHALEHVSAPYEEIKILLLKLKSKGRIVFVVPNEKKNKWNPNDINKHLFTWSEINIGNLFDAAGYDVISVKEIRHRWPPNFFFLYKVFGKTLFYFICRIYGTLRNNISQIQIVAAKK